MSPKPHIKNSPDNALYDALFRPKSIALVGASGNPQKNTARPLQFLLKHGYDGTLYPINPAYRDIAGIPTYADLKSLPSPVEHVFIMIGAERVIDLLDDCAAAGARLVTIYSDGFGESGPEGRRRQEALVERARTLNLRILGPNSIGFADIPNKRIVSVNAAFAADNLVAGHTSLVSQSGSMMGSLLSRAAARGFGFAKSVSVGNEADVSVGEIVDFLVDDPQTRSIILFLETIRQSDVFAHALRRAYQAGKPVIVYKLGRSEQGRALSQSHTGAMAGNDEAIDAFLRAHGALRVNMLDTLYEIVPLIETYGKMEPVIYKRPRIAVITTTGGGAATVVDAMSAQGLDAITPPDDFIRRANDALQLDLRKVPVMDLTLAASSMQYRQLLECLLQAPWCDAVLSVVGSSAQFHPDYAVEPLIAASKVAHKPLAVFLTPFAPRSLDLLRKAGIAAFQTPEGCADALASFMKRKHPINHTEEHYTTAIRWPDRLPYEGLLTEHEALQVFDTLGISHPTTTLIAVGAAIPCLDYPVVAKICSRDIPHKTDVGGVITGIQDSTALADCMCQILNRVRKERPDATIDGILVQSQADRLIELILGVHRDPLVGPVIMLGAGGIRAELDRDFSVRLAPTTLEEARTMIEEVRATQLVAGYRNLPLGDLEALARCIVQFSSLAVLNNPTIEDAEINPLFVQEDGVVAVDGLIRVSEASGECRERPVCHTIAHACHPIQSSHTPSVPGVPSP